MCIFGSSPDLTKDPLRDRPTVSAMYGHHINNYLPKTARRRGAATGHALLRTQRQRSCSVTDALAGDSRTLFAVQTELSPAKFSAGRHTQSPQYVTKLLNM
ncbi:hypothetical protein [uncultured Thiohalocapsa sp.]|uniref:hypothetical protein n=1 Tax=uncultured Thiohalocapsa sp. TaxID=768990 RepID=UPI0025E89A3E|nr:hypothetical protein [uncultured Thiohalocapsa sp.]